MFNRLLFAAFLAVFFAVPKANAITWGEPDAGEHPNVGTLLFVQNGVGFFSCTGTMIAPRVMLTAGHCVAGADADVVMQPNDITYVRFDEEGLAGIGDYPTLQAWFDWLHAKLDAHRAGAEMAPRTQPDGAVLHGVADGGS